MWYIQTKVRLKNLNIDFIITDEAKQILSNPLYKQIGIISLVGKYRTGKSFLLNRVLLNEKNDCGFGVGPTIKPCTKVIRTKIYFIFIKDY